MKMIPGEINGISYVIQLAVLFIVGAAQRDNSSGSPQLLSICHTEDCWRMSTVLHAILNTSADPCSNFEEFLCGGFRSSHRFTGDSLLSGKAYTDYIQQRSMDHSERVTEELAFGCWDSGCTRGQPVLPKLQAYERVALDALTDCAASNKTLGELMRMNAQEVIEEAIDLGIAGVMPADGNLRFERLLPIQSAKSFLSPLTAVVNVASRTGKPALLLVASEPFLGLHYVSGLFNHFPMQASRMLRQLQMPLLRGLTSLMRYAVANLQLWGYSCNKTAHDVLNATRNDKPVETVADVKRLLDLANVTFDLDEFLRLSAESQIIVNDTTDILLSDSNIFLHTVCLIDQCAKRRPDLTKILVMHQITHLALEVMNIPSDARCIDELFGAGGGSSSDPTLAGAFRPLLHGHYARVHTNPQVEAEATAMFEQLKSAYSQAVVSKDWIPSLAKPILADRVRTVQLRFQRESVSEASLLRHYGAVMDGMPPRGCNLKVSPACLLVRARALQMSLAIRSTHLNLDNESPYYDQFQHSVFLPPAFSEPPHYRPGQPFAVRLGLLGFVFAHELTHAIITEWDPADQLKRKHRQSEDKLPKSWPLDLVNRFRSRENCLRSRLAEKHGLNKTNVAEDVADFIGLSVAHRLLEQSGDAMRLPGYMARYTPSQLFYMTSMQTFCSKAVPKFWQNYLATIAASESHTPGIWRIQTMLAGDARFAKSFGCSRTDSVTSEPNGGMKIADSEIKDSCEFW